MTLRVHRRLGLYWHRMQLGSPQPVDLAGRVCSRTKSCTMDHGIRSLCGRWSRAVAVPGRGQLRGAGANAEKLLSVRSSLAVVADDEAQRPLRRGCCILLRHDCKRLVNGGSNLQGKAGRVRTECVRGQQRPQRHPHAHPPDNSGRAEPVARDPGLASSFVNRGLMRRERIPPN